MALQLTCIYNIEHRVAAESSAGGILRQRDFIATLVLFIGHIAQGENGEAVFYS